MPERPLAGSMISPLVILVSRRCCPVEVAGDLAQHRGGRRNIRRCRRRFCMESAYACGIGDGVMVDAGLADGDGDRRIAHGLACLHQGEQLGAVASRR